MSDHLKELVRIANDPKAPEDARSAARRELRNVKVQFARSKESRTFETR